MTDNRRTPRHPATTSRYDQLPSDEQMEAWREAGRFICNCRTPRPHRIGVWGYSECSICNRLICPAGAELLRRRRAAELADGS